MYTIKEASSRSGVGVPLLRAWERRYSVVTPTRTASGYRLYDDEAIDRLRAMRQLIAHGWGAQQAAEHVRAGSWAEISALARSATPVGDEPGTDGAAAGEQSASGERAAELVRRVVDAARDLDADRLEAALDEAFTSGRFEAVSERFVMPALHAIGDAWERGEVSVAGEHAASHAILRRLAMAYEAAGETSAERPVLVGLGPGSRHELGALAFAITARRAGVPILYLGPDLPADSWKAAAVGRRPRAAVIGVPTRADVRRASEVIEMLRSAQPDLLVAVGGQEAGRAAALTGALQLPERLPEAVAAMRSAIGDPAAG
jgi:DNA-binding transcriptional MerR regulator